MKNLVWLAVLAFAGVAFAQEAKTETKPATHPTTHAVKAAPVKVHDVEAEIVSIDEAAKTITIKGDPDNKTVPVEGKALASIKSHKAGDKVTLVCRDNEQGEHQAVVAIKAAKPAAPVKK